MRKYILLAFLPLFFSYASCEKVVNVNLNNAKPQYVIEAEVYEGIDTVKVRVAKTTDYYDFAPQEKISTATVTLSDNEGNITSIPFADSGRYELPGFTGISGREYKLSVVINGQEFTAISTMPQPVIIDSISAEFKEADFRAEGFEVAARFTDPEAQANYYRLVYTINDTLQNEPNDLYLLNDKFNNGKPVKTDLFRRFQSGDKIEFELRTMDENVFDFFITLNDVLNNQGGPAPANPNTDIKGGALGYFGTFTSSRKSVVIP